MLERVLRRQTSQLGPRNLASRILEIQGRPSLANHEKSLDRDKEGRAYGHPPVQAALALPAAVPPRHSFAARPVV